MAELFFVGKKKYNIPADVRDKFLQTYPDAVPGLTLSVEEKTYKIPSTLKDSFMQRYPNAISNDQPQQVLPMQPRMRSTAEVLSSPPELVTAQPATVSETAGIAPVLDPQSEAAERSTGLQTDNNPRDKFVRFRANLLREGSLGYLDMDLDEPQTKAETVVDIFGSVAGTIAPLYATGAGIGAGLKAAGKKLPRVVNWINSTVGSNKTAKKIGFNTARDLLNFNIYGQAYNRPDIKTLEDRLDLALENTVISLAFSGAGALNHLPKYGRTLSTSGVGVIGWEMGGETFEEKAVSAIAMMGVHGLLNRKPKKKEVAKSNEDLLMELYPELSRSEAKRISKKMVENILRTRNKLPEDLQSQPFLLLPERAESIRLARPVGKPYDPDIMPFGRPIGLPSARTTTGFEKGAQVRIKGAGKYSGLTGTVRELRPDGKVKVYIETNFPTGKGKDIGLALQSTAKKFKGERLFTTDKLETQSAIPVRGQVRLSKADQLEFELQQVKKAVDPKGKKPQQGKQAQEEYRQLRESVTNTENILQNPNLTQQQRVAYEHSLNQLKKLKQEMLDAGSIKLYSGLPIHELFKSRRTSLKDLTSKEIDLLYREATKQPLIDINKIGKPKDTPSVLKDVKTNLGVFGKVIDVMKQARNRVSQKESKLLLRNIEEADEIWHNLGGGYIERMRKLGFDKLTEKQGIELGDALKNGTSPQYKAILDDIIGNLKGAGVKIGYIENYFPRVWRKEAADQVYNDLAKLQEIMIKSGNQSDPIIARNLKNYSKDTIDLVNHLIKTGQANNSAGIPSYARAINRLKRDVSTELFPQASFEKQRRLQLPASIFENDARKVIPYYVDVMTKRIALARKFGADGSKATRIIDRVNKKDSNEAGLLYEMIDLYTGEAEKVRGFTGHAKDIVNAFYGFQVGTKIGLGTATIPNITQSLVSTMPQWGVFRLIRGGLKLLDPQVRSEIRGTGILRESSINAFAGVEPKGVMGKFAKLTTKLGFEQINKANLYLAASTFRVGAKDLMKVANSNSPRAGWARKTLKKFGINYRNQLTDDLLAKKMYRFAVDSQLQKNVLRDPLLFNDPKWRALFLFKRFGVRQATMMKDMMMEEFKNGNPMPILRLMAGGALGGEFVIWSKNKIKSEATGDAYYRKEDLLTVERFVNNLAAVGSFGVVSDVMGVDKLSDLGETVRFTITPVLIDDIAGAIDTYISVTRDIEKYGDGFLAVKRNADDFAGVFGSIPRLIAKGKATQQQQTNRSNRLKGKERTAILDLFLEKKGKEAGRRLRLWNKYNKGNQLTIEDINADEIIKRAKQKQLALIKARQ